MEIDFMFWIAQAIKAVVVMIGWVIVFGLSVQKFGCWGYAMTPLLATIVILLWFF